MAPKSKSKALGSQFLEVRAKCAALDSANDRPKPNRPGPSSQSPCESLRVPSSRASPFHPVAKVARRAKLRWRLLFKQPDPRESRGKVKARLSMEISASCGTCSLKIFPGL